jgi:hypothetical protein
MKNSKQITALDMLENVSEETAKEVAELPSQDMSDLLRWLKDKPGMGPVSSLLGMLRPVGGKAN